MGKRLKKWAKKPENEDIHARVRKKLGLTQEMLSAILGVSRSYFTLTETGKRQLHPTVSRFLSDMFIQFQELETGQQLTYRSLETRLFLNNEYKWILPRLKTQEMDCRFKIKELKKQMEAMKEHARDAENAIIVFTTALERLGEDRNLVKHEDPDSLIEGLRISKRQAYSKLTSCWEPEQAKLHGKIEALAGEAKALRRYRVQVMREHNPLKKK